MKKIILSALVLFLLGTITTQAALINVNTVYDNVANVLQQIPNAATAGFRAAFFTATSTTATSTFAGAVTVKGNQLQYKTYVTVGYSDADYIVDGVADDVQIQAAADFARLNKQTLYIKNGTYNTTSELDFLTNVVFDPNVVLKASATTSAVIRIGNSSFVQNKTFDGNGAKIDCDNKSSDGIYLRLFEHVEVSNFTIDNCIDSQMRLGDEVIHSYEAIISFINGVRSSGAVPTGSVGLYIPATSTDNQISQSIFSGQEVGMQVYSGDNEFTDIHVWASPSKGWMVTGIEDYANRNRYKGIVIDTPQSFGVKFFDNQGLITNSRFFNSPAYGTDNLAIGVWTQATGTNANFTITNNVFQGGDSSHRWARSILVASTSKLTFTGNQETEIATPNDDIINNGQRVGINTNTPSDPLNVAGAISSGVNELMQGNLYLYGTFGNPLIGLSGFQGLGTTSQIYTTSGNSKLMQLVNLGGGEYNLSVEGQMLVGTTTSSSTLTIAGKVGQNPLLVASSTGQTLLSLLSNGNLGVGILTPTTLFQVAGAIGSGVTSATQGSIRNYGSSGQPDLVWNGFSGGVSQFTTSSGGERFIELVNSSASFSLGLRVEGALQSSSTLSVVGTTTLATTSITALSDITGSIGTNGNVLLSTGTSTQWVATSSLGITGGGGSSQWTTNGSDIYYNTGKVGIGSTTPGSFLTIDPTGATPAFTVSSSSSSTRPMLTLDGNGRAIFGAQTASVENGKNSFVSFISNTLDDAYTTFSNLSSGKAMIMRVRAASSYAHFDIVTPTVSWFLGTFGSDNFAIYDGTTNVPIVEIEKGSASTSIYIKNTSKVGVASSSPSTELSVNGTTTTRGLRIYGLPGSRALFLDAAGNATSTAASADLASALSNETGTGVAVFATSPTLTTPIFSPRATTAELAGGSAVSSVLTIKSTTGAGTSDAIVLGVGTNGGKEAMRVLTTGRTGFGTTTPPTTSLVTIASTSITALYVRGTTTFDGGIGAPTLPASTAGNAVCILTGGTVVNAGNTTCITSSAKTKHSVSTINGQFALETLMRLRPVSYVNNEGGDERYGLIAEETNDVDPTLVEIAKVDITLPGATDMIKAGEPITVDYQRSVMGLVLASIQEQQKQINNITGKAQKSAEDNWQWIAIGLLFLMVGVQQWQIAKLKK